jgi:hypothetical protein
MASKENLLMQPHATLQSRQSCFGTLLKGELAQFVKCIEGFGNTIFSFPFNRGAFATLYQIEYRNSSICSSERKNVDAR